MKKQTNLTEVISIKEMKFLIEKMEKNKKQEPAMSDLVLLPLCEESDFRSFVIDKTKTAEQFSGYQDGYSMPVDLTKLK
jgi:hypothetical protein